MKLDALSASLRALPPIVKIAVLAAAATVAIVSIVASIAARTPRSALFASPLRPEQLSEVEERLAEWNVPFTLDGDNVMVGTSRRNELLLRLSLAGVPHPHVQTTSEVLAQVGMLTPQAVIEAQTRSGLAGDVETALRTIEGVEDARVIIAPARAAEFADQQSSSASASVRLRTRPGAELSPASIAGIRQFVAASVPGLSAARVTLLDDRGVALGDARGNGGDEATALQTSLQSALDAALGSGVTIVRVHAEYDRTATERRDLRRAPLGGAPVARTSSSESYDGDGKHYLRQEQHDDGGSETSDVTARTAAGSLARVSTAVLLDASRAADLARVRALAAAVVGYQPRRGDTLAVEAVDFHRTLQPKRDGWYLLYGAIVPLLPALALAIAAVMLVRIVMPELSAAVRGALASGAAARTAQRVAGYAPSRVHGALSQEPPHAAAAIISALPTATAAAVLELYPPHERRAIVERMQRERTPFIPTAEEILGPHA
jgi:flagellar biosynthesis/type III secretory pathway M-ring protein FliF/YscJ